MAAADYELSQLWGFIVIIVGWKALRSYPSLSYFEPYLHPATSNPLATDNTKHKNPVEPITSFSDAVCLANRVLTRRTQSDAHILWRGDHIAVMITLFDLHWRVPRTSIQQKTLAVEWLS